MDFLENRLALVLCLNPFPAFLSIPFPIFPRAPFEQIQHPQTLSA